MSTGRRQRRIIHSFLAVIAGWLSSLIVFFLWWSAETIQLSSIQVSNWWVYLFFWTAAALVSGVVTLAGWLLLGLPLAMAINDWTVKRLSVMLLLHAATTSGTAIAIRQFIGDFVLHWAVVIGLVWGAVFWDLERKAPGTHV